jgi:hypothetical protein
MMPEAIRSAKRRFTTSEAELRQRFFPCDDQSNPHAGTGTPVLQLREQNPLSLLVGLRHFPHGRPRGSPASSVSTAAYLWRFVFGFGAGAVRFLTGGYEQSSRSDTHKAQTHFVGSVGMWRAVVRVHPAWLSTVGAI